MTEPGPGPDGRTGGDPGDRRRKALVLIVGVLVFGTLTSWRSLVAFQEARRYVPVEPDCDGLVDFSEHTRVPGWQGGGNIHRYEPLPDLPRVQLGTLQLVLPLPVLEGLDRREPFEYGCLRRAKEFLGANGWVLERIERGPLLAEGAGRLVESIYLLHAEQLPPHLQLHFAGSACTISRVFPGSAAARSGLEVGDILYTIEDVYSDHVNPCDIFEVLYERQPRTAVLVQVIRDQVPRLLEARAPSAGERFGCEVRRLPILAPGQWARPPLAGRGG